MLPWAGGVAGWFLVLWMRLLTTTGIPHLVRCYRCMSVSGTPEKMKSQFLKIIFLPRWDTLVPYRVSRWWFQIFSCSTLPGEMILIWRAYFWNGLKPPTRVFFWICVWFSPVILKVEEKNLTGTVTSKMPVYLNILSLSDMIIPTLTWRFFMVQNRMASALVDLFLKLGSCTFRFISQVRLILKC